MVARLPVPGGDDGDWGDVLNEFLLVEHNVDGTFSSPVLVIGDVKSGMQAADHNGWTILDGRPLSDLSTTQQAAAAGLGITGNLPDAAGFFLVQNGTSLGSVSGSNTRTLAQNQLPNVTLEGATDAAGGHSHTYTMRYLKAATHFL